MLVVVGTGLGALPAAAVGVPNSGTGYPVFTGDAHPVPETGVAYAPRSQLGAIFDADVAAGAGTDPSSDFWIDAMLARTGTAGSHGDSNQWLFTRGRAVFMKEHSPATLGFDGQVAYWDSIDNRGACTITASVAGTEVALTEVTAERKQTPSYWRSVHQSSSQGLRVVQTKFITDANVAVTSLQVQSTGGAKTVTLRATSPYARTADGAELTGAVSALNDLTTVFPRLSGDGFVPDGEAIQATLEVPAGGSATTKVQLGFVTDEIAESRSGYDTIAASSSQEAYTAHVTAYNRWWAENVPYLDTPEDNIDKTLFYRWWLMRFNFLDADIPGNDYQFPTSMEGVLGYNNAIVLTTGMFIDDLKYFRDPIYSYGPWVSVGETSKSSKYVDNPGDPANWSNSYTQYISEAAWRAYQLHGGPSEIAGKLAQYAENDVKGLLAAYDTDGSGLIDYNWGAMTGNDADAVSFHERPGASMDRTENAYLFSNATAAAHAYRLAGDTAAADEMDALAAEIRTKVLDLLWDPTDKLFKHRFTSDGTLARWKETNNYYPFSVGLVPAPGDADYDDDYVEALRLFADAGEYPIFPFFTANQADKAEAAAGGEEGSNNFSVINSTVTFRMLSRVLRDYDTEGTSVDAEWYKKLLYWNAWAHYQNGGDNRLPDQNEFWSEGSADPQRIGYRSWIHHTILGATNFTVIEDAMGLRPREDDRIELDPIDIGWDHFTANNVRYRDRDLTVTWDAPGGERHYGADVPEGYSVFLDGELAFTVDQLAHVVYDPSTGTVDAPAGVGVTRAVTAQLQRPSEVTFASDHRVVDLFAKAGTDIDPASVGSPNLAAGAPVTATYSSPGRPAAGAVDGTTVNEPFWGTAGSPGARDSIEVDLGSPQPVDDVRVYFYASSSTATVPGYAEPSLYTVEYLDGTQWRPVPSQARTPAYPRANLNRSQFPEVTATKVRVTVTHASGAKTGVKEVQVFRTGVEAPPSTNLAPHVDAWRDAGYAVAGQARLVGTVKDDGLPGDTLTSAWTVVSAPEGGTAVFDDASRASTVARFTTAGEYTLRLSASDGELETVKDLVVTGDVAAGGTNVASSATPTAEFTAAWNDVDAVKNGTVMHSGGAQSEIWATWSGNRPATRWLQYTWPSPVRVASTEVSFWGDQGSSTGSGSGVNIPKAWTAQAWDGTGWVDVSATSGYTVARSEPNTLTFAPVTTTRLRLVLEAAGPGTGADAYAAVGVSEWKVFADSPERIEAVDVRTSTGVVPTLPAAVTGVFSDGSRSLMPVVWAPVTADQVTAEGTFTVVGVIDGSPLPAKATVWVRATPPGQITTVDQVAVTTTTGTPPQLPPSVTVQFNDGSRTSGVPVSWDTVEPSAYAAAGTFTVDGTVVDSPVRAVASVTVRESAPGEDTIKPVVTLTTDPVLPDHGWSAQDVTVTASATDDRDPAPTVELSLDGTTWSPATVPLVLTAEGQHEVRARATDAAGNVSAVERVVVSIDRTAPTVVPVPDPVGRTVKAAASDSGSGVASVEYRVGDATAWTPYTRTVLVGLDETTVTLRATDTAGNVSTEIHVTVPASDGSHRRNVGLLATPTASFTAGWNSVAGLNDDVAPTSSADVSPDDNANVWGAWPEVGTQWVQYDWDAPVTVGTVRAYFVSNLDGAGVGISVPRGWVAQHWDEDAQAWLDVEAPSGYPTQVDVFNEVTFSPVTTTRLRLVLEAQGTISGQSSLGIKEWQVVETSDVDVPDTVAPTLTVGVPPLPASGWYTEDVEVTAAAVDDRDGAPSVEVSVGDGPWAAWTGSRVLDTDARHRLSFRATDASGNVAAVQTVEIGRDTTAPEPSASFDASTRTVTVTADDALSGVALVEHRTGGGPWTPTAGPVATGDAAVTVRFRATDVAGNTSEVSALDVPAAETEPMPGPTDPGPVGPTLPSGELTGAEVVSLGVRRVAPGGQVPVTVTGAQPGAVFRVEMHSDPVVLGTVTVAADGTGSGVFTIPASTVSGEHRIVLVLPGGSVQAALTVVAAAADGPAGPGRAPTAAGTVSPSGSMASTGADGTVAGALLAGLLVVGGVTLALTVRRRRLSVEG